MKFRRWENRLVHVAGKLGVPLHGAHIADGKRHVITVYRKDTWAIVGHGVAGTKADAWQKAKAQVERNVT